MQNNNLKLKIVKYPNPILRKRAREVKEITPEIKELALDMAETMNKNQGLGLAAPQVGELKRIIVVSFEDGPRIFINPEIVKKSKEKEVIEEGCLSFPGLFLKIKRAKETEVKALDENGKEIQIKDYGLISRVLQHEIDHLDGILFIDRLTFWQRLKFILKSWF
jgi:peptide deformylase